MFIVTDELRIQITELWPRDIDIMKIILPVLEEQLRTPRSGMERTRVTKEQHTSAAIMVGHLLGISSESDEFLRELAKIDLVEIVVLY